MSTHGLRVAHLIWGFHVGGLERVAERLAVGCRDHGIESRVYGYGPTGTFRDSLHEHAIATRHFPDRLRRVGLPVALGRALRRDRIDVLHTHHFGPLLFGTLAATPLRVPILHTEHSREAYDVPRRRLLGRALSRANTVICVSEELADWHEAHFARRPAVVLNGVPVPDEPTPAERDAAREMAGVPRDAYVIGCVARLSPEKDHATLLEAFTLVREQVPNAVLVMVGGGPIEADVERLVAAHSPGSVRLLGRRNDVQALYPAFDVITLSSRREGLPLALLEGMAAGLPAVATAVGEIPTLVSDDTGQVVPPGDPAALSRALIRYAGEPAQRLDDGTRARRRIVRRYGAAEMISRYAELYRLLG